MTGHQLKVLRIAARLSQEELAAKVGTTRQTLIRYEAAPIVPASAITREIDLVLAQALTVKPGPAGSLLVQVPQ